MEFFWYDYETWGKNVRRDRIVQFGGVRTDEELAEVARPIQLKCKPGLDCPIGPGAVNVHGIMPNQAHKEGLPESEFARLIHAELIKNGTCNVAYNGMSFDHEMTRMLFYRNLRDPYAWAWKDGNTYWDTLELMRAAFLLRPEALKRWPQKSSGKPSFKLESLSEANLDSRSLESSHDAVVDVAHMLAIARLVRERACDLWEYALGLRFKKAVLGIMSTTEPVLYVVGKIDTSRHCATLMTPLDYWNGNSAYGFDLANDPRPLLKPFERWTPEDWRNARRSIRSLKCNQSPFVCEWSNMQDLLSPRLSIGDILAKMQLSEAEIQARHEMLQEYAAHERQHALHRFLEFEAAEKRLRFSRPVDPDEAIYDGFFSGEDELLMYQVLQEGPNFSWRTVQSDDRRVEPLIFRYIARNFPEALDEAGTRRWEKYCRTRQLEQRERRQVTSDQVFSYELRDNMKPMGNLDEAQIRELTRWQDRVRERLNARKI
ncbi:MAG: exodeoxyribonuclease I [Bacteroidota bacterium]|nr:exodeoxyribonuclease I [Bacteroidota bacterium]